MSTSRHVQDARYVTPGEWCPYQVQTAAAGRGGDHECKCSEGCGVLDQCDPSHHKTPKSAYKLAIAGIVGPTRCVNQLYDTPFYHQNRGDVYTFLMNMDLIQESGGLVDGELNTLASIAGLDPTGDFTGLLITQCDIPSSGNASQEHTDFAKIDQQIAPVNRCTKVRPGLRKVQDFFHTAGIKNNNGKFPHIKIMYLANAGESLASLMKSNLCAHVQPAALVTASNKLLHDYHKISGMGISHMDMHTDNIRYVLDDTPNAPMVLKFKLIDFGMNDHHELGQRYQCLRFLNDTFDFETSYGRDMNGCRVVWPQTFRNWHPVQYPLFKICFHIMSRSLTKLDDTLTAPDRFINSVHDSKIVCCAYIQMAIQNYKNPTHSQLNSPDFGLCDIDITSFVAQMVYTYKHMYSVLEMEAIWMEVLECVETAILNFNHRYPLTSFMDETKSFDSAKDSPCYPDDEIRSEEVYTRSYLYCYEYFYMDFHALNRDANVRARARERFDEYSIASTMVLFMLSQLPIVSACSNYKLLGDHIADLKERVKLPSRADRVQLRSQDNKWEPMSTPQRYSAARRCKCLKTWGPTGC